MHRQPAWALVVIALIGVLALTSVQPVRGASDPNIVVQVLDQYGAAFDGAQVQIWGQPGPLVDSGTVVNGFFTSISLGAGTYQVIASTSTTRQSQVVTLGSQDAFVTITLTRLPEPVLSLTNVAYQPTPIVPGENFVAKFSVSAQNAATAYAVFLSLIPTNIVSIVGTGSVFYLGNIAGNTTKQLGATISIAPLTTPGNYQVQYTLNFTDVSGVKSSSTGFFFVPVSGNPQRPQLVASSINFIPSVLTPGSTFLTEINVTNSGDVSAFSSSLAVTPNAEISLVGSSGVVAIGTLRPNQSALVSLKMSSSPTAPAGPTAMGLVISYTGQLGLLYNQTSTFTITLAATPDLKVGQFTLTPAPLRPGSTAFLALTLINVGGGGAFDAAMTLTGPRVLTGNFTNYLGSIPAGSNGKATFFLSVSNSSLPGSYPLRLLLTYDDLSGRNYSALNTYDISIEPFAPPSVTVTNIVVDPPVLSPGVQGTMTIFVKNSGSSDASNVVITVGGGTGIVSTEYFGLGTITAGSQATEVVGVNVGAHLKPGSYLLSFNSTYTDPSGTKYFSTVPLKITVYPGTDLFSLTNIAIVGAVALVGGVALLVLRRRKIL